MASAGRTISHLRTIVRSEQIDIVHANNLKMLILAAAATAGRRIPVLWHVRDIFPSRTAAVLGAASRAAHRVLTVSRAVAGQFRQNSRKLAVVYNAVELPALDSKTKAPCRAPTIGYVGRLDAGKGIGDLVSAFAAITRRHPAARLLLAGDGPEAARLPDMPGIVKLGYQDDLSMAWRQIDICVQPSNLPDSFPRAVIEAMSWGKPVVGARIGGIPEAVADGTTGLLFRPGDPDDLCGKLLLLLDQPGIARSLGAAGRLRCEQSFSIGAQIRQLNSIYEDAHALCHP
jgi:glycosyltransferase involved in cell wall biosynthesis